MGIPKSAALSSLSFLKEGPFSGYAGMPPFSDRPKWTQYHLVGICDVSHNYISFKSLHHITLISHYIPFKFTYYMELSQNGGTPNHPIKRPWPSIETTWSNHWWTMATFGSPMTKSCGHSWCFLQFLFWRSARSILASTSATLATTDATGLLTTWRSHGRSQCESIFHRWIHLFIFGWTIVLGHVIFINHSWWFKKHWS